VPPTLSLADIFQLGYYWECKVLLTAVKLDVFGALAGGACSAAEVSRRLQTDRKATEVLLNALVSIGLLRKSGEQTFCQGTPTSSKEVCVMKQVGVMTAIAIGAIALLAAPLTARAGGEVEGKVTFSGEPPAPKEFLFSKFPNPEFCGKNPNKDAKGEKRLLHEVQVGKDGDLKNTVVAVTGINDEKFQAEFKGEDIIAKLCEFLPYTGVVVPNQSSFRVMNTDADPDDPKSVKGVLHNPHAFEKKGPSSTTIFNIGLPEKDKGLDKPIKLRKAAQGSVFKLICDQHEFMQFWALPITSPYYAVVGEDGKFEIKDVPAGKYKLVAWHPALNKGNPIEQEIEVKDGASASAKFEFKP